MNKILYIIKVTNQSLLESIFTNYSPPISDISIQRHFIFVCPIEMKLNLPRDLSFSIEPTTEDFYNDVILTNKKHKHLAPDVICIVSDISTFNSLLAREFAHLANFKHKMAGISINKEEEKYDYGWKIKCNSAFLDKGWYNIEPASDKIYFVWSSSQSSLYIKGKTATLQVTNHNPELKFIHVFIDSKHYKSYNAAMGENLFTVESKSDDSFFKLSFLVDTFIPNKQNAASTDTRELGVSLNSLTVDGILCPVQDIGKRNDYALKISKKSELLDSVNIKYDTYFYTKTCKTGNFYMIPDVMLNLTTSFVESYIEKYILFFYNATSNKYSIRYA